LIDEQDNFNDGYDDIGEKHDQDHKFGIVGIFNFLAGFGFRGNYAQEKNMDDQHF